MAPDTENFNIGRPTWKDNLEESIIAWRQELQALKRESPPRLVERLLWIVIQAEFVPAPMPNYLVRHHYIFRGPLVVDHLQKFPLYYTKTIGALGLPLVVSLWLMTDFGDDFLITPHLKELSLLRFIMRAGHYSLQQICLFIIRYRLLSILGTLYEFFFTILSVLECTGELQ